MTSEAKIAANRRNARKSTGPRTTNGKSRSRLNGVTHGFHATVPVLRGEDMCEYEEMEQAYMEHYAPVGPLENLLVSQITAEQWRLRRFDRAEVALGNQVLRTKVATLLEKLDKESRSFAYSLLGPDVGVGEYKPSSVADNYLAHLASLRGLHWTKANIVELDASDKKFIVGKIAEVLDVDSTILETLVPADECAPQDRIDRQRRSTMRVLLSYVAELKKLQEARLTLTLAPASPAEIDAAPTTGGRRLKLVSAGKPADQIDQASQNKAIEGGGS